MPGARDIPDLLDRVYQRLNLAIIRGLADAGYGGIRPAHAAVFETIGQAGRSSAMAELAGMTKQSMGELVAHLERHGYVERVRDPDDARAYIIRLTALGRDAAREATRVMNGITDGWSDVIGQA